MIALIRRLRSSAREVRPSDWLLVGVEGLLVFLGIVAAFQLQEWATDRREAKQMERIGDGLLDEARTTVALLYQNIEVRRGPIEQSEQLARMFSSGQCPSNEDMQGIRLIEVYEGIDPPSGVYDELVSGAGLSALPSSTARLGIDFYRNSRATYLNQLENFRDNRWPLLVEDDPNVSITFDPEDRSDMRVDFDMDRLCGDREFIDRFNYVVRNQSFFQRRYRMDMFDNAAFMCVALADMQGQKCTEGWIEEVIGKDDLDMIERRGRETLERADI